MEGQVRRLDLVEEEPCVVWGQSRTSLGMKRALLLVVTVAGASRIRLLLIGRIFRNSLDRQSIVRCEGVLVHG